MDTVGAVVAPPVDDETILIELDLTTEWTSIDAAGPSPRPGFWISLVLAPLLVLTLLGGGGRTRTLGPMFELGVEAVQTALVGNILYLTVRSADEIRAYDVRDGRPLWRRSMANHDFAWARYGEVIAITGPGVDGGLPEVTAVDGRTGRELWRQPAAVAIGGTASIVAIRRFSPPVTADAGYSLPASAPTSGKARVKVDKQSELLGVHAMTGTTVWTKTLPVAAATFDLTASGNPSTEAGGVLVIDSEMSVRAVDLRTGQVIATPSTTDWQLPSREQRLPKATVPCLVYLSGIQAGALDSRAVCLPDAIRNLVSRSGDQPLADSAIAVNDQQANLIVTQTGGAALTRPLVAALNPATGRWRALAQLPGDMPFPVCMAEGGYLLCHGGSKLGVWRLEASTLP